MNRREVAGFRAGEELDLLVYDRIMGRPPRGSVDRDRGDDRVRRYSTDIRHAERVLLRIVTEGEWSYLSPETPSAIPAVAFRRADGREARADGPTRAVAICRAALRTTLEDPKP